jgi:hypothetical protein
VEESEEETQQKKTGFKLRGQHVFRDSLASMSESRAKRTALLAVIGRENSTALYGALQTEYETAEAELEALLKLLRYYKENDWDENSE